MRALRRCRRTARLLGHIGRGLWQAARYLPRTPPPRTEAEWAVVRSWHRRALELAGIEVEPHSTAVDGPALFVANHVSWLDIGVMSTIVDAGFIGKRELAHWPVLGFLIRRGGTIFVDRDGRDGGTAAAEEMARRLERGERVAVFPEGTTSRGDDVRRFHPRLFEAARIAGVPVQPVALRYDSATAPFVDNVGFVAHLLRVLAEPRIRAELHLLEPIDARGLDRRRLAACAETAVRARVTATSEAVERTRQAVPA
jgi:1-acyl-sn-glycerol-3-phosphate acyltransferase